MKIKTFKNKDVDWTLSSDCTCGDIEYCTNYAGLATPVKPSRSEVNGQCSAPIPAPLLERHLSLTATRNGNELESAKRRFPSLQLASLPFLNTNPTMGWPLSPAKTCGRS